VDALELTDQLGATLAVAAPAGQLPPSAVATLEAALTRYRGDFLHGFALRDGQGFEGWMLAEQERLRQLVLAARNALVAHYLACGTPEPGLVHANHVLTTDPFHEEMHRHMLLLLAQAGQRGAALAHYERYCRLLQTELALSPAAETTALYERIRQGELGAAAPTIPGVQAATPAPTALPLPATSFVGREAELAHLTAQLAQPQCRLLTLVGPGGTGKTRLALEAARQLAPAFASGVAFVALAPVASPDLLAATIAAALGFRFSGTQDQETQLLDYLRPHHMLLVLDNCEHLLAGAGLVAAMHEAAPGLTLLATSRERFNLEAEWVEDVAGLDYPVGDRSPELDGEPAELEGYAAIQLFVQRLRQVQPTFQLTAENRAAVLDICQLVRGLPLALELAASWGRSLGCTQIAQEIKRSADFLATSMRDKPTRHRSLRAVFNHSWQLLNAVEQAALSACSVFRGSFSTEAGAAVAAPAGVATKRDSLLVLHTLSALVEKSLLRHEADGRFTMHELLRQFAEEHVQADAAAELAARQRHSTWYGSWLHARQADFSGPGLRAALAELQNDIDNVRAGWAWAVAHSDAEQISRYLPGLVAFYDNQSRFEEAFDTFANALITLSPASVSPLLRAMLLTRQALFGERLGRYDEAEVLLLEALTLLEPLDNACEQGLALRVRGWVAERQGTFEHAKGLYQQSLAHYQRCGDQWGVASAYHGLGSIHEGLKEYAEAQRFTEASLTLRREIGDQRGVAFSLNNLGIIHEMLGNFGEAVRCYQESQTLFLALDDRWAMLLPLSNLGDVATTQGDYQSAYNYYRQGLQIALERAIVPKAMLLLVKMAQLMAQIGADEQAVELLALPLQSPTTEQTFRVQAQQLLETISGRLPMYVVTAALQRGVVRNPPAAATQLNLTLRLPPKTSPEEVLV
jgi:predicted ATPase